jgi:8-amino-7-oxononanoate synthase
MSLFDRWNAVFDALRAGDRYRTLQLPCGVDFTSNDYLGYASGRGELRPHATNLPRSGTASRLLRGHHPIWEQVEAALARWHRAEAALMMTSGYAVNEGLLSTVIEPGDWVVSDERNHASLIDGLRLNRPQRFVYRHNDLDQLADGLSAEAARAGPSRERFIVTEALFSMEGDRTPLAEIVELAERYGAHVIVDEAHTTGCFGPAGSGRVDELGLRARVLATVHTGGKALGVPGAYVCGPERLKEYLVNRCRHLIFTTAPAPALGAWWLVALRRVQADDLGRRALNENAVTFRTALARHGLKAPGTDYIVPLIVGEDARAVRVADRLRDSGYDIRAIRPPTVPVGMARLRLSVHADHEAALLQDVAAALDEAIREG